MKEELKENILVVISKDEKKFDKKAASLAQYYANSKTYLEE